MWTNDAWMSYRRGMLGAMSAMADVRYRYHLRVSGPQAALLQAVFDACRFVWNQALGRWEDLWRQEGVSLGYAAADRELTDWRSRFDWLTEQPSVPQQQVLRDLYRAIAAFFDKTNPTGRPRFKSRKVGHATARWTRQGFKISGSGLGHVGDRLEVATSAGRIRQRVVWSRPLPSPPTSVTVYRDVVGRWWASFVVQIEVPAQPLPSTGRVTGLDLGLDTFATVEHPAHDIPNPRLARARAKALARSQRNLARKRQGSANRAKARRRRARVEAKIAAQRADFHHKAARDLMHFYDRIGVEDLAVKQLSRRGRGRRKAGLNRAIADAGWAGFLRVLAWQATKTGKQVVVLRGGGSTQQCSSCGVKAKPRLELSDRVFRCQECGLILERDRNAARNLHPDHHRNHRLGCTGAGADGDKTPVPAGTEAA
jgi:putative transposase